MSCEAFTRKGLPCRKAGAPTLCHVHMHKGREPGSASTSAFDHVPLHVWHNHAFQQALGLDGAARLCCSSKALAAVAAPTLRSTLGCPLQVLAHLVARTAKGMIQLQHEVHPQPLPYMNVKLYPSASVLRHISVQIIQHPKRIPTIHVILFDRIRRHFTKYNTTDKCLTAEVLRSFLLPRALQSICDAGQGWTSDASIQFICHAGRLQSMGCKARTLDRLLNAERYPQSYGKLVVFQPVTHKINLI